MNVFNSEQKRLDIVKDKLDKLSDTELEIISSKTVKTSLSFKNSDEKLKQIAAFQILHERKNKRNKPI